MKKIFKIIIATALTALARIAIKKYKPKIIAVTGSVGKTSTKDALYALLSGSSSVRKSQKSFNSEIGVPLTILGCENAWNNPLLWIKNILKGALLTLLPRSYPEWLVLEIGADRPNDIKRIASWLRPDVVIVTRFGKTPAHIEFFKNADEVVREKSYLVSALKNDGLLILNSDEPEVLNLKNLKREKRFITYGILPGADVQSSNYEISYKKIGERLLPIGISFKINYAGNSVPVMIKGSVGRQFVYPTLAAIAFGVSKNINMVTLAERLSFYLPPNGRMKIIEGIKNTVIMDDSYNSSPVAAEEALATLRELHGQTRKIAVLGDMMELGKYAADEHKKIGRHAAHSCDLLVTVGLRARYMAMGALDDKMDEKDILQFDNSKEAGVYLKNIIKEGDAILVKGSQAVRTEKIIEEIMAHPEKKDDLLVRQENEWKKR